MPRLTLLPTPKEWGDLANQTFQTAIALGIPKKAGTWRINSDRKTKSDRQGCRSPLSRL
ncbi:hypothetical protein QUB47_16860 [Microcoleus sp. AT9_B5]